MRQINLAWATFLPEAFDYKGKFDPQSHPGSSVYLTEERASHVPDPLHPVSTAELQAVPKLGSWLADTIVAEFMRAT